MNKTTLPSNHSHQKINRQETNPSGKRRFVYIFMLLLTIFSLFLRVSGAGRVATGGASGGTSARVLVFHHQDGSLCEDLTVTAAGDAVFSNCGNGIEKRYVLNDTERAQLQNWIGKYSVVNFDHNNPTGTGTSTIQLYLNGQGSHQASIEGIQQLTTFATTLAAKTASSP